MIKGGGILDEAYVPAKSHEILLSGVQASSFPQSVIPGIKFKRALSLHKFSLEIMQFNIWQSFHALMPLK